MDDEKWSGIWKDNKNIEVADVINRHAGWMNETNIAFTPTFFLNGKKILGRYDLKDVELLIPRLAETTMLQALK